MYQHLSLAVPYNDDDDDDNDVIVVVDDDDDTTSIIKISMDVRFFCLIIVSRISLTRKKPGVVLIFCRILGSPSLVVMMIISLLLPPVSLRISVIRSVVVPQLILLS